MNELRLSGTRDPFSASRCLEDRVAVVTGAASGIGLAASRIFARSGARVVLADLNGEGAKAAAEALEQEGLVATGIASDVGDEESIRAMIDTAVASYGGLDILFNNAADTESGLMARDGAVVELDAADWDRTMRVNLRGPMLGCKYAIPRMIERGGGAIVNTSSASGLTGDLSRTAYGVSKAGLSTLTQSVAVQYGKQGIRCNAVAPGVIETPSVAANVPAEALSIYRDSPLGPRLGAPEDIAAVVTFLVSDAAAFVTGQILSVDGGLLAHHPAVAALRQLAEGGQGSRS